MLVGIISRPRSITCQIPKALLKYGSMLLCPNTELAVSVLQVKYPAPNNVAITIEFTTNTTGVLCVSLALLLIVCIWFSTYLFVLQMFFFVFQNIYCIRFAQIYICFAYILRWWPGLALVWLCLCGTIACSRSLPLR